MYLLLLSVIYLAFISLGLPDSMLGSAWPTLYAELNVPISYMGIITIIISLGTVLSSLLTDRAIARLGTRMVTAISIFLTATALFGFSTARSLIALCIWGIPYGLGAGAIDAALNNYVATHYSSRHMSWLHCFWGVGTIISPYIMSYALVNSVWQNGYRIVSAIQLCIGLVVLLSYPLWKANTDEISEKADIKPIGFIGVIKIKGALAVMVGFLCYCAAEITATLWTSSYFEGAFGVGKEEAAVYGSICFIGITSGRFLAGFIAEKLGDRLMIGLGGIIAAVGTALIAMPIKELAIAGFVVFGLGCAPIYPSIMHSIPIRFGKERSQSIIGIQMASAYLGSTIAPAIFGVIADFIDIRILPLYLLFFILVMLIVIGHANKETNFK